MDFDEFQIAGAERSALLFGSHAVAGQGRKVGDRLGLHLPPGALFHDGAGQRVFALLYPGPAPAGAALLRWCRRRQNVGDFGLAVGDGAGLVQRHDIHLTGLFQGGLPS